MNQDFRDLMSKLDKIDSRQMLTEANEPGFDPYDVPDSVDSMEDMFSMFEAELDELLGTAERAIDDIVDNQGAHKAFRKSLRHQLKKLAEQKLAEWTRAEIEWLQRLPPEEGGDLPMADPTGTLK